MHSPNPPLGQDGMLVVRKQHQLSHQFLPHGAQKSNAQPGLAIQHHGHLLRLRGAHSTHSMQ